MSYHRNFPTPGAPRDYHQLLVTFGWARVSMERRSAMLVSLAATADKMKIQGQPGSSGADGS